MEYQSHLRGPDKLQGCFTCVKFQDDWLEPEDHGLDFGTKAKPMSKTITIDDILEDDKDKQIEDLKAELKKLKDEQQSMINKAVSEALTIAHKADNVIKTLQQETEVLEISNDADELDDLVDSIFAKSVKPSLKTIKLV